MQLYNRQRINARKDKSMKIYDLVIDIPKTLGVNLLATSEGHPYYEYTEGVKTDKIAGYQYEIMAERLNYDKVTVKIAGQAESAITYSGELIPVRFENLTGKAWTDYKNGSEIRLSLTATAIFPVNIEKKLRIGSGGKNSVD